MTAPTAPALRCPRCRRDVAGATTFCPGCGAPLALRAEGAPAALDVSLDLDRRGDRRASPSPPRSGGEGRDRPSPSPPRSGGEGRDRPSPSPPRSGGEGRGEGELPLADDLSASVADLEGPYWMHAPAEGGEATRLEDLALPALTPSPPAEPRAEDRPQASGLRPQAAVPPVAPASPPTSIPTATSTAISTTRAPRPEARGLKPEARITGPPVLEVHVTRADPWRRVVAWLLDGGPFVAAAALLAEWLGHEIAGAAAPGDAAALAALADRERVVAVSVAAVAALALAVYATLSHALAGATLGKRVLGIRVVGPDGRRPSPGRSALRSGVAGVSLALLGLGFLVALFSRTGRALHDVASGTWVVKAP